MEAERDAAFILELLNDPSFIANIGDRRVRTQDDAREYIRKGPLASYDQFGFGLWLVELRDGVPIGMCGLLKRNVLEDVDIGFAYLPAYRSQGYGHEAARAVLDHARDVLGVPRVVAIVNENNVASARLLEKLGMEFEKMVQPFPSEPPLKLFKVPVPGS
jgi:RimJ/RimL family protein N-acetyltransferase